MSSFEDPQFSAPDLPFVGRPQDAWIYKLRHSGARDPHRKAVTANRRCPRIGNGRISTAGPSTADTRIRALSRTVWLPVHSVAAASL